MRLAVFLIFLAQLHPAAAAENTWQVTTTGEELAPLTDDLSRADLFKLFIASGERENPAQALRGGPFLRRNHSSFQKTPSRTKANRGPTRSSASTSAITPAAISASIL